MVVGFDEAPSPHSRRQKNCEERLEVWAAKRYGDQFVGLYRHDDEPLVHWHIVFADDGKQIKTHMSGHGAANFAKQQGADGKGAQAALDAANMRLQDEFQAEVGGYVGLARTGPTPENGRKSRKRWKLDKLKAEAVAEADGKMTAMEIAMHEAKAKLDRLQRERDAATKRADQADAKADAESLARVQMQARAHRETLKRAQMEEAIAKWMDSQRAGGKLSPAGQSLQCELKQAAIGALHATAKRPFEGRFHLSAYAKSSPG